MPSLDHARRVAYLDHAATTPLRPEARDAMCAEFDQTGNASSLHASGRRARRVIEESRESIAASLGVRPSEVTFTSGGTESDNVALKGLFWSRREADARRNLILVSSVEHPAVLDSAGWLQRSQGAEVLRIPVDSDGLVDAGFVEQMLRDHRDQIAVVSVMWANNETGVIQPIEDVALVCRADGVPLHTDGCQAVGELSPPSSWDAQPAALSLSAHKFGGPIGVGALVLTDVKVEPLLHGGGQQLDVRSGTLTNALAAGMAAALAAANAAREADSARLSALRDSLVERVFAVVPDSSLNGGNAARLPGIAQVSFPGCEADSLLMLLDAAGVECSAGSACSAGVARPSQVLTAMGQDETAARSALRFSLGWTSTQIDIDVLLNALPEAVTRARKAHPSSDKQSAVTTIS